MTQEEFIAKMRELDPFAHEGEVSLDMLYDRFKIAVEEMERLEDIEDNTIEMQACIDGLHEKINKLEKKLQDKEDLGDHIPHID